MSFDLEDVPRLTDRLCVEGNPRLVRNFSEYIFPAILSLRDATCLPNDRLGPSNQSLEGHEFLIAGRKCVLLHRGHVVIQTVRGALNVTPAGLLCGTLITPPPDLPYRCPVPQSSKHLRKRSLKRLGLVPRRPHPDVAFFIRGQDHRHRLRVDRLDDSVRCRRQEA
jgi:hypothetical protein